MHQKHPNPNAHPKKLRIESLGNLLKVPKFLVGLGHENSAQIIPPPQKKKRPNTLRNAWLFWREEGLNYGDVHFGFLEVPHVNYPPTPLHFLGKIRILILCQRKNHTPCNKKP